MVSNCGYWLLIGHFVIGSTIMWFLRRWSLTYLATQEGYYQVEVITN